MIALWIVVGIVGLHLIGVVISAIHRDECKQIEPYGKLIKTSHGHMHMYEMGDRKNETIVLLPGLGNALPCADFGPLMRDLSKNHHVVCIEFLGMGFSDETTVERDNENYIEELCEGLRQFGCEPPYILMPHSCSGVYCEYYAAKCPDEVAAMIMLDCTSTGSDMIPNSPGWMYTLGRFWQTCGVMRLMNAMMPSQQTETNGYTAKERSDYHTFLNHNMRPNFASQNRLLRSCIQEVRDMEYPKTIPTLKLQSEQAVKRFGEEYQLSHLRRLGEQVQTYMIPGSTHMMHEDRHTAITEVAEKFLEENM